MDDNHKEVMKEIQALKDQVVPLCDIYTSAQGFGKVSIWVAKYIIMPAIVLTGAALTYKNLKQ